MRSRALLAFVLVVPVGGCTLYYLAADPYDGLGGGADGGGGNADGSSDAARDAYSPECGSLSTVENCGACSHVCDPGASCVATSGQYPYNCSAILVDLPQGPLAIAVHDDELYVVDDRRNVWTCTGACDTQAELYVGGTTSNSASIAVSDEGVFWISDNNLHGVTLDGGALSITLTDTNAPMTIAAGGDRVAWTNSNGIRWVNVNGPPITIGAPGSPFAGADSENVALVHDGGFLAWSMGEDVARYSQLLGDGGSANITFDTLTGSTNLTVASDNDNVFLTWRNKSGGEVDWLPSEADAFAGPLDVVPGAMKQAPVFGGNGLVYWSGTNDSISYCPPTSCSVGHNTVLSLNIKTMSPVTAVAATPGYIFFLNNGALYRVQP
ncbi:MAG: hypothetical protein ACRELY_24465 [Polyangiaceae bacterium]